MTSALMVAHRRPRHNPVSSHHSQQQPEMNARRPCGRSGAFFLKNRLPSRPGYHNASQRHPDTRIWGAATLIDQRHRIVVPAWDQRSARRAPVHWGSRPSCLPTQQARATRGYKSLCSARLHTIKYRRHVGVGGR